MIYQRKEREQYEFGINYLGFEERTDDGKL